MIERIRNTTSIIFSMDIHFQWCSFTYWVWKNKTKVWEKSIAGIYFILIEIIIASSFTSFSLFA